MKRNKLILLLIATFVFWQCSNNQEWVDQRDSVPPGPVSNPTVINVNGGAKITYVLPNDKDLLGVKAKYYLGDTEKELEVFSSVFTDTIQVKGFPDTKQRIVKLICLDKSFNESEPIEVEIKPLTPPIELIGQSLKLFNTYGGVYAKWENRTNDDIAISLYYGDDMGDMLLDNTHYSHLSQGEYYFRGFDAQERKFNVEIRDRWNNYITIDTILTPLFEKELLPYDAQTGQRIWNLYGMADQSGYWRGDICHQVTTNFKWEKMIDGITFSKTSAWSPGTIKLSYWYDGIKANSEEDISPWPYYFTIDFTKEVSLSRHRIWHYSRNAADALLASSNRHYQQANVKHYEIWGTNSEPKKPADFSSKKESLAYWTSWKEIEGTDAWKNDWVKLADCSCLPPSGAQNYSECTADDIIYADEGFESLINPELSNKKFRYVRFVVTEVWQSSPQLFVAEIKFWGKEE